eukprot:608157-Hanusia_phi.AAC.1
MVEGGTERYAEGLVVGLLILGMALRTIEGVQQVNGAWRSLGAPLLHPNAPEDAVVAPDSPPLRLAELVADMVRLHEGHRDEDVLHPVPELIERVDVLEVRDGEVLAV